VRLVPRRDPLVAPAEQPGFRRLVVGLFGFRRKQLGRGLRELTGWEVERVTSILGRTGLRADARPEVLTPPEFAVLCRALVDGGWTPR
jgi:16S rRNA A1518/A1519 N6-dimethyltransferase RsmA/KsgA/DIM1 with predicted DNA glycosylase/AP lyase activity